MAYTPRLVILLRLRLRWVIMLRSLRNWHNSSMLLSVMFWFSMQIFLGHDCLQHLIAADMNLETSAVWSNATSSSWFFAFESLSVVADWFFDGLGRFYWVLKKTGLRCS